MEDLIKSIQISDVAEAEEILKSAGSEDLFEKAKWNVGDTKVYQGITYEVGGFNAKGTPLWRKKKDSGNSGNKPTTSADKAEEIMLKNMTDKVMDKGFLTTNSKYNDKSKVELKKTDKGNWRCFYDGRDIGVTLNSSVISEAAAKKAGWYKDDSGKTTDSAKPKQGKYKLGDTKVYQGITYEVGGFNDKGTPLWRKKKDTNNTSTDKPTVNKEGKKSSKIIIDETTIDKQEYDRQFRIGMQVDNDARDFAKTIIEGNINKTKKELEELLDKRPGAKKTIEAKQAELTKFISQKKAVDDAIKESNKPKLGDLKERDSVIKFAKNNDTFKEVKSGWNGEKMQKRLN